MSDTPLSTRTAPTRWIANAAACAVACVALQAAGQGGGAPAAARTDEAYGVIDVLPVAPAFAPPSAAHDTRGTIRLAQSSEFANDAADPIDELLVTPTLAPNPSERGLLQGLDLTADWSPRLDDADGLGRSTLGGTIKIGVPPKLVGIPLLVAPRGVVHLVDGPDALDVPARLYDLQLGFSTFRQINERWLATATVNVGVYGDDDSLGAADALRPNGSAVAIYTASPTLKWVLGVAYLNREDIAVLPAVGVIIDRGAVRYELSAPRPRIVWRLPSAACEERSVYLGGELGGGAWAVRRLSGDTDTLNLSRYGLLLGYETANAAGWKQRYELGYLFGQEIEYADTGEELSLDDSLIVRAGLSY